MEASEKAEAATEAMEEAEPWSEGQEEEGRGVCEEGEVLWSFFGRFWRVGGWVDQVRAPQ